MFTCESSSWLVLSLGSRHVGCGEICIRLDGLPLAIELAASRVRLLELEPREIAWTLSSVTENDDEAVALFIARAKAANAREILARLERHLPVLTTGASNVPPRQRSLRATIDWGYALLPPADEALFLTGC